MQLFKKARYVFSLCRRKGGCNGDNIWSEKRRETRRRAQWCSWWRIWPQLLPDGSNWKTSYGAVGFCSSKILIFVLISRPSSLVEKHPFFNCKEQKLQWCVLHPSNLTKFHANTKALTAGSNWTFVVCAFPLTTSKAGDNSVKWEGQPDSETSCTNWSCSGLFYLSPAVWSTTPVAEHWMFSQTNLECNFTLETFWTTYLVGMEQNTTHTTDSVWKRKTILMRQMRYSRPTLRWIVFWFPFTNEILSKSSRKHAFFREQK